MMGYYDIVLALIPVSLFGITGFLVSAGITLTTAVPIAAVVSAILICHALFVNAPIDEPLPTEPKSLQTAE